MGTMGEGTENGSKCGIPGNGPITTGLDSFEGLLPPMERSQSPMVEVSLSLARVEKSPEKTASRLTAIPDRTCFHSELRKGGRELADWSDQNACLRSLV